MRLLPGILLFNHKTSSKKPACEYKAESPQEAFKGRARVSNWRYAVAPCPMDLGIDPNQDYPFGKGLTVEIAHRTCGHAVSASHLAQISTLPPNSSPHNLAFPEQYPVAAHQVHNNHELTSSLHQLAAFSTQLIKEASTDFGHFLAFALSSLMALKTGRSNLAVEDVFDAGKTTSLSCLFVWSALTTSSALLTVAHQETPAEQTIPCLTWSIACISRIPTQVTVRIASVNACGKDHHLMDVRSDNCQKKEEGAAKVLVCTTGIINVAAEGYRQHSPPVAQLNLCT